MTEPKSKDMQRVNYYMPKELHDALKNYSNQTDIPMSAVIRRALETYIKTNATPTQSL